MGQLKGKLVISCKSSQGAPIRKTIIEEELKNHDKDTPKIFDTNERLSKDAHQLIKDKQAEGYAVSFFEEKPHEKQ